MSWKYDKYECTKENQPAEVFFLLAWIEIPKQGQTKSQPFEVWLFCHKLRCYSVNCPNAFKVDSFSEYFYEISVTSHSLMSGKKPSMPFTWPGCKTTWKKWKMFILELLSALHYISINFSSPIYCANRRQNGVIIMNNHYYPAVDNCH